MEDHFQHPSFIRLQCFDKFSLHPRSLNNVTLVSYKVISCDFCLNLPAIQAGKQADPFYRFLATLISQQQFADSDSTLDGQIFSDNRKLLRMEILYVRNTGLQIWCI